MPAAPIILAAGAALTSGTAAVAFSIAAIGVSYVQARRAQAKTRSAAAAARAQALHDQLLSRRTVVDNPLSPRRRQYGRGLNAGVQTFAMADRTPNSATDRAQNSFMYMLSDKPIHKFVKVIFREAVLEDFDPEDYPGAASDEELLKFVVPWTAGPPVVLGPQPAGEDPRSDAGLAVDRYPYTGSTDADDKNNLADATLFAFVGTATESKAQAPPILFEGTGAGVDLADRSKFLSLGSAWSAARTIQANPMTGVGVGRISGTQGFVWDIEGAVVRDWRGEESGRDIFAAIVPRSEPVAGTNFSAGRLADLEDTGLFAAKEVTGFHVLGIVGTAPSRSGRINQNVFVFGNDGAKSVRDNLLEAAGVAIVDEPAAGADEELVGGSGASAQSDGASATTIPLPAGRNAMDYVGMRFVFQKGEQSIRRFVSPFAVHNSGGATLVLAGGLIKLSVNAAGTSVTWDYVNSDDSAATDADVKLMECVGVEPLEDRHGSALTAWKTFLASADNVAAVKQLNLVSVENPGFRRFAPSEYGSFAWGRYVSATDYSDVSAVSEVLWNALPEAYSCNPVLCLLDWIMDSGRPSGFKVDAATQLDFLNEMLDDADECDRLIPIGNFVLQSDNAEKDGDGNFMHQSSYEFVGGRERNVDPQANKFITISADGTATEIASFGGGIVYRGSQLVSSGAGDAVGRTFTGFVFSSPDPAQGVPGDFSLVDGETLYQKTLENVWEIYAGEDRKNALFDGSAVSGVAADVFQSTFSGLFSRVFSSGDGGVRGQGSFDHNGLTYNYRWQITLEEAGYERTGPFNLHKRQTYRPRWSVEMDRFNSDILIRNEHGSDASAMPSSLELSESIANPLAAAACVLPVVFLSRTATDGTVSNISRRLEATGFEFKPTRPGHPYTWEIPEGTLTITVTRLASGTLATTLAVAPSADYSAVVVTSAHLEVCARKYELNALLSFGDSERENMQRFEESVVGDVWDEGLALRFRVARWTAPVKTIRTADFAGQIQISRDEGGKAEDVTTGLQAEFLDVANAWRPAETQTLTDREALSQTEGIETTSRVTFPFANSRVRATAVGWQQLALERGRRIVQISPLRFGFEALQRGDRVVLSMNEFGFADEIFQVRRVRPEKTGVSLLLREDKEEWYSDEFWSTALDETPLLFSGRRLLDEQGEPLLDEQGEPLLVD